MRWNLRLAAANRGIWKASELQRMLAARGMVISAGKMSGLWSGNPNTIKLDEFDVICAVLGCGVGDLLLPEPGKVPLPGPEGGEQPAAAAIRAVTPWTRGKVAAAPGELPALRQAAPCREPARPLLLHRELPGKGRLLPPQERDRVAAAVAAPGAHVGIPLLRAAAERAKPPPVPSP